MLEYVILLGAVALIVVGGLKLFGTRVKTKIASQADLVAALDDRRKNNGPGRGGDERSGVAPADDGKVVVSAADGKSDRTTARSSSVNGVSGTEGSASATEKVSAGSKLTSTVAVEGGSASSSDVPGSGFNYYGWLPAGAGVLVLLAVLFKGKRRLEAEAGADQK